MKERLFLNWMNFGNGYDLLAGEKRELGINFKEPKNIQFGVEQNNILEAREISLHRHVFDILRTRRSISVELLREWAYGKGFGTGAEIIRFLDSFSINRYSIYICIEVIVKLNSKSMEVKEISLTEEAAKLLNTDPKGFRDRYGDESIVGVTKGGICVIILEITTKTGQERKEIINQLKPVNESELVLSNIVQVLLNMDRNKIKINTFQQGGDRMILGLTNVAEIVETLNKFSSSVNEKNALPLLVTTMPYFELVSQNEKRPLYAAHYDGLLKFADVCSRNLDDIASLQYVVDHQDEFIVSDKEILSRISHLRDDRKRILRKHYEQAHNCFSNVDGCNFGGEPGLIDSDYPKRI